MIFDIDKFKQYNDIFGHDMGDKVLAYTAQRVQNVIRSSDVLIRWGGDEFVGVFP
ncbi:MAG: GGDEF domain-containing protein [Lachnospira sp.]|nr:GGDEF domain-containing protein [Lachnospira sp.]